MVINGYRICETLGEGGFSTVKLGIHIKTGNKVALKLLKEQKMSESANRQVRREIQAMSQLEHPNITHLISVDVDAKYKKRKGANWTHVMLVVLELAEGGELFDYLAHTGKFEEELAATYFFQLLQGVHTCHEAGIAHRDLKPENLLISKDYQLKVADFGLAASKLGTDGPSVNYTECGTKSYMSPEMFLGEGYDAKKADVWAAGVILFTILAGFPPYQEPVADKDWWFNKLARQKFDLFWRAHERSKQFSPESKEIITAMLHVDPEQRPSVGDLLAMDFCKGQQLPPKKLSAMMEKRMQTMREGKQLEREQTPYASSSGSLVQTLVRALPGDDDVDPELDELPSAPPTTRPFALGELQSDSGFTRPSGLIETEEAAASAFSAVAVPQPYDPAVPCFTQIETTWFPSEVLSRLSRLLRTIPSATVQEDVDNCAISAQLATTAGVIKLQVQVYAQQKQLQLAVVNMVVFRRLRGDVLEFRRLFHQIRDRVQDMDIREDEYS